MVLEVKARGQQQWLPLPQRQQVQQLEGSCRQQPGVLTLLQTPLSPSSLEGLSSPAQRSMSPLWGPLLPQPQPPPWQPGR